MELRNATPTALCPHSLAPILDAIEDLARDGSLDDDEVSLRLDQFEQCALGSHCAELVFDPVAAELVALVTPSAQGAVDARWARRVVAYFTALRGARRSSWSAVSASRASLLAFAARPGSERDSLVDDALEALDDTWDAALEHFPLHTAKCRSLEGCAASPPESFTAAVIADLTLDVPGAAPLNERVFTMLERELAAGDDALYFFKEHARLPADADCTALACSVLLRAGRPVEEMAHRALDRIAANVTPEGVVATYFASDGDRAHIVDPVVCVNALYLARQLGRAHELRASEALVFETLREERYLEGTRYYPSPDTFLHFLGRLVCDFPRAYSSLRPLLARALLRRRGATGHPLDLAQRALLARRLGLGDLVDETSLRALRRHDGSWPADSLFRYGRTGVLFGSASLSTAFALRALIPVDTGAIHRDEEAVRRAS